MVLVDTSVWVAHFRHGSAALGELLTDGKVLVHPFISGELACGNLPRRERTLADLNALARPAAPSHAEVCELVEARRLWRYGIGWIDAHLLASALISDCEFWTLDMRLAEVARKLLIRIYQPMS
jgi:predicted nucleic acid-binding protein